HNRKHPSNVYQALGATPPDYLAQQIIGGTVQPTFIPQTHYIHPRIDGQLVRYFEWMGAAHYTADRRSGAMHGKVFLLESIYAGIDEQNIYGRMDFAEEIPDGEFEVVVNLESWADASNRPRRSLRLNAEGANRSVSRWTVADQGETFPLESAAVVLARNFEFKVP